MRKTSIYGACLFAALLLAEPSAFGKESGAGFNLDGKPNPASAANALSMTGLREICLVPPNDSASDLLRGFGNRTVTERIIPRSSEYVRKMKADEVGIFAITDRYQRLIIVDLTKMPYSMKEVVGSCFRAETVQFWRWPDGSWDLTGRDDLLIIP
jgi:hypothetical protein